MVISSTLATKFSKDASLLSHPCRVRGILSSRILTPSIKWPALKASYSGATPSAVHNSSGRTFNKLLKVVPIEGKGFGVVATQDIEANTRLFCESPAALAVSFFIDRAREAASISSACAEMDPSTKERF
jgi:hypothetical protein